MSGSKLKMSLTMVAAALFSMAAVADNPYMKANNTWISVSGTVESVSNDTFMLDYGKGTITVEMDDGDRDADAYKLLKGDKVTVTGMVDKDFYEKTTIEASSVYVKNIDTYFYSSAMDEEDAIIAYSIPLPPSTTLVQGTITAVNDDNFVLDTGLRSVTVEVDDMAYNPLDEKGYQKLDKGDVVRVSGNLEPDIFKGRVFEASYVTTLVDTKR